MTKDEVYRKLDDKIKDLKSTRVFKKVTPKVTYHGTSSGYQLFLY